jgi:ribosomal protein S18 acetylase RimI-like enzyme
MSEPTLPMAELLEADAMHRLLAIRIPANTASVERLLIVALPNECCQRSEICGELQISMNPAIAFNAIDWIFVKPRFRRHGLATRLWRAAESILGQKLEHNPVTKTGKQFAASFAIINKCSALRCQDTSIKT